MIVGEVLFDVFPDGSRILGGAPFNVAWHLQAFGHQPMMVTRIGRDDPGDEIRDAMHEWGFDLDGIQTDRERPTGAVQVALEDGQPEYTILADQAYDAIEADTAASSVRGAEPGLLYHGTLAARSDRTLETIRALRREFGVSVFVDVNLRDPWWRRETVDELLEGATWIKLNEDELEILLPGSGQDARDEAASAAERFRSRFEAFAILLTRGENGASVVTSAQAVEQRPEPPDPVVDTVGAGDAFSAVWIAGQLRGWSVEVTLRRALDFASRICSIRGATTDDRKLYADVLDRWRHAEV